MNHWNCTRCAPSYLVGHIGDTKCLDRPVTFFFLLFFFALSPSLATQGLEGKEIGRCRININGDRYAGTFKQNSQQALFRAGKSQLTEYIEYLTFSSSPGGSQPKDHRIDI